MRDIKFRAWNGSGMEYGGFSVHATGLVLPGNITLVKANSPLMQFTGLHDKNGKEIYEEDVMSFDGQFARVYWCDEQACFRMGMLNLDFKTENITSLPAYCMRHWHIVGNIYENPELLI